MPGKPMESHFLIHPLDPQFGGGLYHSGGRQFETTDDPDWKNDGRLGQRGEIASSAARSSTTRRLREQKRGEGASPLSSLSFAVGQQRAISGCDQRADALGRLADRDHRH